MIESYQSHATKNFLCCGDQRISFLDEWNQRVLFVLVLQCERVQRLQFPDVAEEVERRLLDFPLFRQLMKEEKKEFTEAAPKPFHMSAVFRVLSLFVFF